MLSIMCIYFSGKQTDLFKTIILSILIEKVKQIGNLLIWSSTTLFNCANSELNRINGEACATMKVSERMQFN